MSLEVSDIKFSNPSPGEGEKTKIYAKVTNKGNETENKDIIFYYTTEMALNEEKLQKFLTKDYEMYRERIENLEPGGTTEIVFDWVADKELKNIFIQAQD
ncbi:MAG: hypothetical protein R6U44_07980 [Archaeoglobaceae archaeon]